MGACSLDDCKKKAALIVGDCKYCKKSFCSGHRLPETHLCHGLDDCRKEHFDKNKLKLESEKCVSVKVDKC